MRPRPGRLTEVEALNDLLSSPRSTNSSETSHTVRPPLKRRLSLLSFENTRRKSQTLLVAGSAIDTHFDEQLFSPEFYELGDDSDAEAQHLLPYATWHPDAAKDGPLKLPGSLSFVQSDAFLSVSGAVVFLNIVCLCIEVTEDPGASTLRALWICDQVCLLFYVAEVFLRMLHFQRAFFSHEGDALWNVSDLVIVIAGIIDQWLRPVVTHEETFDGTLAFWLPLIRGMRILRFLRLLKLVGVLFRSDLRWTESVWFNSLVSSIIIASVVLMGLETDLQSPIWEPINDVVLLFFTVELIVNIRKHGCLGFFTSEDRFSNILDLSIVVFGAFDQWVLKLWMSVVYGREHSHELGDSLMVFRLLRLLRILRVLRLVKAVQPLYVLALGIVEAVQSMFWVLLLTLVALYSSGIIMARAVGHGACLEESRPIPDDTREAFATVGESMFTLFVLMNGEDWSKVMPMLNLYPGMKAAFVFFIIISTWALLSVMTGVVSDNMIFAHEAQSAKDDVLQGERRAKIERALQNLFLATGGIAAHSRLSQSDWEDILNVPYYSKKLLDTVPSVPKKDLIEMFSMLEAGPADGMVSYKEVMRGVHTLCEPISGRTLLQVDSELKQRLHRARQNITNAENDVAELRRRAKSSRECIDALLDELFEVSGMSVPLSAPMSSEASDPDATPQSPSGSAFTEHTGL